MAQGRAEARNLIDAGMALYDEVGKVGFMLDLKPPALVEAMGQWMRTLSRTPEAFKNFADYERINGRGDVVEELAAQLEEADTTICELCYRVNPQHAAMNAGAGCKSCKDREDRLKAIAKATGE